MGSITALLVMLAILAGGISEFAPIEWHPYHAALLVNSKNVCSGAVVSLDYVITAAQCLKGLFQVDVILGSSNPRELYDELAMLSNDIIVHENFSSIYSGNDIALVKLPRPLARADLVSSKIRGVTLPLNDVLGAEEEGTVTGYGFERWGLRNDSKHLSFRKMKLEEKCDYEFKTEKLLCAKPAEDDDVYVGDPGSPLVVDGVLVGLTSFRTTHSTLYTKVSSYRDWILEHAEL